MFARCVLLSLYVVRACPYARYVWLYVCYVGMLCRDFAYVCLFCCVCYSCTHILRACYVSML